MKQTYDYEAKAKARARLRQFVEKVYPKRKQRKNLRVLTLLGHEDHELREIWDPLEVPRENIVSVESEKKAYDAARKIMPNVCIMRGQLEDVVWDLEGFDVINLDFVSPFGLPQRDILRAISGRGMLREKGVLATWFLGQREGGYTKQWFLWGQGEYYDKTTEKIENRSDLVSSMVCSIMIDGTTNFQRHPIIVGPNELVYNHRVKKEFPALIQFLEGESLGVGPHQMAGGIAKSLIEEMGVPTDQVDYIYYQGISSYFSVMQDRLKYVGDGRSPMLVDINFFKQLEVPECRRWWIDEDGKVNINMAVADSMRDARRFVEPFLSGRNKCLRHDLAPREIADEYAGFSVMQLAAFKAHQTMGTYEK